jgi:hypothetical protein
VRDAGVAAGRDAQVLLEAHTPNSIRKPAGLPAVADHDDVGADILLSEERFESPVQILRSQTLREDDDAESKRCVAALGLSLRPSIADGTRGHGHGSRRLSLRLFRRAPPVAVRGVSLWSCQAAAVFFSGSVAVGC